MLGSARHFGLRGNALSWAVGMLAGCDFLLFGYDQGVMGGLLTLPSFVSVFPEIDTLADTSEHRATVQGITVASYNLGCFAGAVATIFIGDILGRRKMIFLGSLIMVVGAILQASAFSIGQLVAGRIITGFGNGMNTSTVPTWASETSKSHNRGKMVMIEGAMITGGVCLSYWLDFGFSFVPGEASWRFPIAFQIFFALIMVCFILEMPESPRWLILKGREDEALSVISALNDLPTDDRLVLAAFSEVKASVSEASNFGYKDLFAMGPDREFHRVFLGYVNQVFQQISGINLITYYAATIYERDIGLGGTASRALAAANGTEYFLASWIAVPTIERYGRRSLMLFGAIGMSATMVLLTITDYMAQYNIGVGGGTGAGIAAAVLLFVFNTFFAIGWLGMTWLYPAEIVPLKIRAPANGLSTSANWIFNFLIVMITPVAFNSIGYQTYIIFAVINAFIVPVVYFYYPETAYRSLEEIDDIFRKSKGWLDVVKVAREEPKRYGKNGERVDDLEDGVTFRGKKGEGSALHRETVGRGVLDGSIEEEKRSSKSLGDEQHVD